MAGSDTLEEVSKDVLAVCPGATGAAITYKGGGSGTGENAMTAATPTQTVASMSRFLNPTAGVCAKGTTAEAIVIGLDGLAIVGSAQQGANCGGGVAYTTTFPVTADGTAAGTAVTDCPGCAAGTNNYTLNSFKDALALIYAGLPHAGAADCAGPVRKSLVNSWSRLFEGTCGTTSCTQLKHAFRRADLSGTTDTFVALVGLSTMPLAKNVSGAVARPIPFCNAFGAGSIFGGESDYLDKDPIRRTCDANEQICAKDGTLGLVTVIDVPTNQTAAVLFPTVACSLGKFKLMPPNAVGDTAITTCPNGAPLTLGQCWQPFIADAAGNFVSANCIAGSSPVQGIGGAGLNGKAYNLYVKAAATGRYLKDGASPARYITGATFRMHTNRVTTVAPATAGVGCQTPSATEQIGCLVQASPCSIGFAGREAELQPQPLPSPRTVVALSVKGIAPTVANIENLTVTPSTADDYPLARKLFFATVAGFENVTGGELELAKCMGDSAKVGPIMTSRNFIPVPGGVFCQDFNETQTVAGTTPAGCGAATNVNSCAGNPAGIPSTP